MTTDEDLYDQWEQLYYRSIKFLSFFKRTEDVKHEFFTMPEGEEKERIRRTLRRMIN
jgi:hypothetical protein